MIFSILKKYFYFPPFSGGIVGELCSGLDSSNYLLHCSKSREVVVVGNNKGAGGIAVYKGI